MADLSCDTYEADPPRSMPEDSSHLLSQPYLQHKNTWKTKSPPCSLLQPTNISLSNKGKVIFLPYKRHQVLPLLRGSQCDSEGGPIGLAQRGYQDARTLSTWLPIPIAAHTPHFHDVSPTGLQEHNHRN